MDTILLLVNNTRDRRLLETCLKGKYRIIVPEKDAGLDGGFDLCISDSVFLKRKHAAVAARKEAEKGVILPVLLVTKKKEAGLWNSGTQQIIDEMIFCPIQEMELHTRVASLLRTRRLSMELKRHTKVVLSKDSQSLAESETWSRSLFQNSYAAMLIIDPANGAIVDANTAACAYYGWPWEILSRMNIADINTLAPDQIRTQMETARANHQNYYAFKHRLADRTVRDVQVYSGPVNFGERDLLYSLIFDVTEEKRAEEALQQERDFTNAILDKLPGVFYLYDEHLRFLRWNHNFQRVTGYTDDEIHRMSPLDFFARDEKELLAKRIQEVFDSGASSVEAHFVSKDGTRTPYYFTGNRTRIAGRVCLLGVGIDISARKRAEDALRTSEERLRLSTEIAHVAVWEYDFSTNSMARSKNHDRLYGLEWQEKWEFETFLKATHPDDRDESNRIIQECVDPGGPDNYTFDFRVFYPDTSIHWLSVTGQVVERDAMGKSILVRGCIVDITERKRIAEDLKASEIKFRSFFENSMDAILLTWPDGRILSANPAAVAMFGFSEDELINAGRADVVDATDPRLGVLLESRQKDGSAAGEITMIRKDGKRFPAEIASALFKDSDGRTRSSVIIRDITERRRAEIMLRGSQERTQAILDNTPALIYLKDLAGRIVLCNRSFESLFGLCSREILGKTSHDLLPIEVADKHRANDLEVMAKQAAVATEEMADTPDGKRTYLSVKFPVFDTSGKMSGVCGISTDISEHKRAEELLRRNEAVLRLFVEYSPAAIAMFDRKMKYIAASRRYLTDYELGEQNLTGRSHYEVFPEMTEPWKEIHRRCLAGAIEKADEDPFPRRDGRLDWVRWEIRPWHESTGNIGGVILFSEVITERKQAEAEIHRRAEELLSLNTLGRAVNRTLSRDTVIADAIAEILRITQADLVFIFLREGGNMRMAGFGPQSARSTMEQFPVHRVGECLCGLAVSQGEAHYSRDIFRDQRCTWEECKRANLRSFAALPLRIGEEVAGVLGLASYGERDFEEQAAFLETLTGQIAVGLNNAVLHEQIEKHTAELEQRVAERTAELVRALAKAEDAERLKSIFLASMSHELRTPLNSIIGFTGILLMGLTGELNPEQKKQLQMVKTNGQHLLSMINDILDISKIEAGKVFPEVEAFDLIALVKEVTGSFEPQIREKRLTLHSRLSARIKMRSDRRRIKQILMNLMSNAVKYTEEGRIDIAVRKLQDDRLEVKVSDTGIGMSKENMKRLFQPFQQVGMELTKSFEGTGLGLYLSQKLANLLGGEIVVESQPGKGSVFTAILPLAVDENSAVFPADNGLGGRR